MLIDDKSLWRMVASWSKQVIAHWDKHDMEEIKAINLYLKSLTIESIYTHTIIILQLYNTWHIANMASSYIWNVNS